MQSRSGESDHILLNEVPTKTMAMIRHILFARDAKRRISNARIRPSAHPSASDPNISIRGSNAIEYTLMPALESNALAIE